MIEIKCIEQVGFHFYLCKTDCICFYVFPIRQNKYLLVTSEF